MPETSNDPNAADWSNYWQGRTAGETGAALAGSGDKAGVETDAELAAFWDGVFADVPKDARILDLACGAGSALRAADRAGLTDLTGLDISDGAIKALATALPNATGITGSAAATGLADGDFHYVVSQFGFEYAGAVDAAKEAGRLLAPEGAFVAVAHKKGGAIERECQAKLAEANALKDTGFIAAAEAVFRAAFDAEANPGPATMAAYETAAKGLLAPRNALSALAASQRGLASHLLSGAGQLFERRKAYALDDILSWLSGMTHEIDAYAGRMRSMTEAALDEAALKAVAAAFEAAGCAAEPGESLTLGGLPAAWIMRARKG